MNTNNFAVFGSSSILVTTFPEYHRTPRGRIIKLDKRPGLLDYSFREFCEPVRHQESGIKSGAPLHRR